MKQILLFIFLTSSSLIATAATETETLQLVTSSAPFRQFLVENVRRGHEFYCTRVTDVKPSAQAENQVVTLDCIYNPHDLGDVIWYAGTATIRSNQVTSFTAEATTLAD